METPTPVENVVAEVTVDKPEVVVEEIIPADASKHAFVTMAIIDEAYIAGALVLGASLKEVGSTAARIVLISSDASAENRDLLAQVFDKVVEVPVIDVKIPLKNDKKVLAKQEWLGKTFTKLHALNFVEYEKVAILDADIICVSNPDNIFQVTTPAAIFSNLLRPNDAAMHNKRVPQKTVNQAFKETGIRGCTYVLQPSSQEFERAINMMTVKPKIIQYVKKDSSIMDMIGKNNSSFALLAEEDEDEEESKPVVAEEKVEVDASKNMGQYDEEALRAFEELKIKYPYDIYESSKAIMGFSYGDKKSPMGADEKLIADMYRNNWYHIHARYGHPSWRKNEAGPSGSVFMHYASDCPWTRTQDWPDYEAWDAVAMNLMKKSDAMRSLLIKHVPALVDKEARGSPAAINPPAPVVAPVKKTKATAATATATASEPAKEVKPVSTIVPTTRGWGTIPTAKK